MSATTTPTAATRSASGPPKTLPQPLKIAIEAAALALVIAPLVWLAAWLIETYSAGM